MPPPVIERDAMHNDTTEVDQRHPTQETDTNHLDELPTCEGEEDDEYFSDDPDVIFKREYARIDTIPLQQRDPMHWQVVVCLYVFVFATIGGAIIGVLTYPTVTIEVAPMTKEVRYTAHLALQTRILAPVTVSKTLSAPTTGHGHQDATNATGTLTLYNGLFTAQTIPVETIFTGHDGSKVATDQAVTIPAAQPPQEGEATVNASALTKGAAGNIPAGEIAATITNGVLVKNLSAFTGGRDARDYQAVAKADIDALTTSLSNVLSQQMPFAFILRPGETVYLTHCHVQTILDHTIGQEATMLTSNASDTCSGVAYNQNALAQQATIAFTMQTSPGANYQLAGSVQVTIVSLFPLTVSLRGLWVYHLSQDEEQLFAQQVAGDTPAQAKAYLLQTGVMTRVTVPQRLPKDPGHIRFLVLIDL